MGLSAEPNGGPVATCLVTPHWSSHVTGEGLAFAESSHLPYRLPIFSPMTFALPSPDLGCGPSPALSTVPRPLLGHIVLAEGFCNIPIQK